MKRSVVFCVYILGASLAESKNYITCNDLNDPSFSECLGEAANSYFADLDEEPDEVYHSMKPLKTTINSGRLSVGIVYNITKFFNSTKSAKVTLKYDASSKMLTGTLNVPHVGYEAHCEVNGKFGVLILHGEGVVNFQVRDMQASFETHLNTKPGSKTKFEMEELKLTMSSIRNASVAITEIHAKNKILEKALKDVARNFSDHLYAVAKEQFDNNVLLRYEDLLRVFLKKILGVGLVKNG